MERYPLARSVAWLGRPMDVRNHFTVGILPCAATPHGYEESHLYYLSRERLEHCPWHRLVRAAMGAAWRIDARSFSAKRGGNE